MNKKSYRIVFNAARNQQVAVAETGQSDHGEPGLSGGGQPCVSRPHTAVVQKLSFAIWVALGLVSWASVAQAQADRGRIVADHSAPSNNQPTILVSPNGTPVVNIQTPSAGGVSRNVYTQFDVGTQGAVLNNSRTGQRTQIGGGVGGNPSLARGTAKVILNEVNSPAASQLRGTIEVSGDRAQVVIANPSGVSCDGCGFINANRVTITTGTPVMNGGSLENYRVEQGTVTIGASGMNASSADYTDVISRATVINGKIYAKDLKIILGANEVSADGSRVTPIEGKGERPTVSIDSSQLGGMYTNKIIVVSTESGVGVKNSGQIGAAAGDVRISAEGQIINAGSIQSAGNTFVSGQSVVQSGSIYSEGATQVRGRKIDVQGGLIGAKGQTTLEGRSIIIGNEGTLAAGMQADGSLASDGRLSLNGQDIRSQGKHFAAGDIEINGSASVNLNDSVSQTQMTMKIADTASLSTERAKLVAGNFLLAAFVMSNRGGQFYQTGSGGSVFRVRELDNTEGTILTRGDTTLDLGKLNNTQGLLGVTEGTLELQTQHLINRGGSIEADGNLRIRSGGVLDNTEGRVSSTKTLEITDSAQQRTLSLINTQGTVVGLQGLAVQAARSSGDGQLLSEGALQLGLQSDLHHTGRIIGKLASLDIQGVFTNLGSVQAEELSIHSQSLKNQAGAELLANQAHIEAGTVNNQGLMDVGQLRIDANETTNSGRIYGNEVSLGGGTLTNERGGVVAARVQLDVGMQQVHNQGDITSQGSMRIGGALDADGHAIGQTQLLRNSSGLIEAADQLNIAAVQTVNERTHFTTQERQTVQKAFLEPLQSDEGDVLNRAVRVETTQTEVTQDSGAGVIRANHLVIKGAIDNDKSLILGVDVQYDPTHYREIGAQGQKSQHTVNTTNGQLTSEHTESSTFEILNTRPLISANETLLGTNKDPAPVAGGSSPPTAAPASPSAPAAAPGAAAPVGDMTPAVVSFEIPQSKQFEVSLQGPSLVKSDERFSGYREWLASSAQLEALGVDPAGLPKRLGDGYYEQRLLRDQVNHLTGHQYLAGDFSAEGEYRTLLDAGVEAARELGLQVGKSLTAEQVKALKKDIVWLETREMTLASGDKVQALVPQLYARVNAHDAKADPSKGAGLASGRVITIDMSGEFTQKGNYSANDQINIKADDLKLQGQILSRDINLQATQDVVNEGAQVMAARQLVVVAGRDILASSTVGATATGTQITRLAAWASGNHEAGQLIMQAGRDIRLDGSLVQNASKDITSLVAGQDIVLGTVSVNDKVTRVDGPNRRTTQVTQDVGSQVLGLGDLHLDAGRDLVTKAATIRSTEGLVQGVAGRDIHLQAGAQTTAVDETTVTTKRRWFKKVTTVTHTQTEETLALGSSLSGVDVQLQAGGSIHATGVQVVAQRQANLVAAQDIFLDAAQGQSWQHVESHRKTKGLFSSGSLSLTLGTKRENTSRDSVAVQHMGTHVASLNGDVGIQAGRDFKLEGSQVLAPNGLVQIAAQDIQVIDSRNTLTAVQDASVRSSGLTVGVSSPWLGALQTIDQLHTAGTNTDDARMLALASLAAGMNVYNAANANKSWTVNATLGRSQQRSHMQQSVQSGAGSTVAGKNIVLRAVSDPSHPEDFRPSAGRDITIQGSQLRASEVADVRAEGRVEVLASRDEATQSSSNESKSAGVGVSAGYSNGQWGTGVRVEGSRGEGQSQAQSVTHQQGVIEAGQAVQLQSGGDVILKGGVIKAAQVSAEIGGRLHIESLQDTQSYGGHQESISLGATVGPGFATVNVGVSSSELRHEFASVAEQSAIRAGEGGFQVNARGGTVLRGGQITSTQAAIDNGKNVFSGPLLEVTDVHNQANTQGHAYGYSANVGTGSYAKDGSTATDPTKSDFKPGFSGGLGRLNESAQSVSKGGISGIAGDVQARTGDTPSGLTHTFDASQAQANLNAQVSITQAFSSAAPKAVADFAQSRINLANQQLAQASQEADPQAREQMQREARDTQQGWAEGGQYRAAAHTLMGALGAGWQGAAGAGAAANAATTVEHLQETLRTELSPSVGNTAATLIAQVALQLGTGVAVAAVGGVQGGVWATAVDVNNRQLHEIEKDRLRQEARKLAESAPEQSRQKAENYWYRLLYQEANGGVDNQAAAELSEFKSAVAASTRAPSEQQPYVLEGYFKAESLLQHLQVASDAVARLAQENISMSSPYGDGAKLTAFRATEQEKANPNYLGSEEGSQKAKFALVNDGLLQKLYTINGSAEKSYADIDLLTMLYPGARAAFEGASAVRGGSRVVGGGGKSAGVDASAGGLGGGGVGVSDEVGAKGGGAVVDGLAFRSDLPSHMIGPDGFTKSGQLSGTHNLANAKSALDTKGATYTLNPTGTAGVYEIPYTYTNPATGKVVSGSKTVYDPAVFGDQTMINNAQQAGQQAWMQYLKNPTVKVIDGSAGGVNFRSYVNVDKKNGNAFIGNVHPIK